MTSYTVKQQRLPAKEGLPGEKILFFVLFLFLVSGLMPSIGLSAFVDREGIKTHLYDITFMEKGHAFTAGSSTRKYTFTSTAIFKNTYKGKDVSADVVDFRHEATWSGNTHQLTIHSTEKHGYYFDLVYRCGKLDPFLAPDLPQCQEISRNSNWSGALTDAWPSYGELPQRLYKAIVMRTSLVYEAMAKSMEPVAPKGEIKSPPGSVFLQVRVADDLVPEPKTPVFFIIESKDGKPAKTLSGEEIHQVSAKFINGMTAFKTINGIAPGVYSFHPKSVSGGFDGPKVYFNVVAKADPGKQPYIVNPTENKEFEAGDKVYINALFTQEKGFAYFDYQVKKHGEFKPFGHDVQPIHNSMADIHQQFPENYIYRVRVAVDDQTFDLGNPAWSKWRYFKIGKNFIPGFKRGLSIISPTFSKTYTNSIPVKIVLPKKLDKKTTMALNWIWGYSAPSAPAGQVPEASVSPTKFYSQKITVKPGVDYAESKISASELMQHKDHYSSYWAGKAGSYQLEVVLKTEQGIAKAQTWGPFDIGVLGEAAQKEEKKSGTFSLDAPIFTAPEEGQIFMAPATVELKVLHGKEKEISTRLQYCPFSKDKMAILHYQDSSLKPVATSTKESITTVTYRIDKSGFWRAQATATGKLASSSAWRSFKVDALNNTAAKSVKLEMAKGITSSKAPRILAPANHAVFQKGQDIVLKIDTHGTTKPMTDEVQFKDRNNNFTLLYTGTAEQSTTGGTVETKLMIQHPKFQDIAEGAAEYRVRVAFAHKDEKGFLHPEEYSPWLYIKILPRLKTPVQIPQKSFIPAKRISAAQLKKSGPAGKMAQKSINPQPEPPGKTMRSLAKSIEFSGLKRFYHAPATVRIGLKNANLRTMEFELRYKQSRGNGFKKMTRVAKKILRRQGQFTLQLSLTDPGYYQIRFRSKKGAPWSRRTNFQVTGDLSKMAARVQHLHQVQVANVGTMMPHVGSEPAASAKPARRAPALQAGSTARMVRPSVETRKISSSLQSGLQLAKKKVEPAKIRAPRNGQKFMMNGSSYMLHGEVQHAAGQQLEFDLRLHKGGKVTRLHPTIRQRKSSRQTKIVIGLRETGDYSLRVKYKGTGSRWSGWTNFTLGRLMKKIPKLQQKKPQIKSISKKTFVPQMQIIPQVKRIR